MLNFVYKSIFLVRYLLVNNTCYAVYNCKNHNNYLCLIIFFTLYNEEL